MSVRITKLLEEKFPFSRAKRFNIYYRCGGRAHAKQEIERFLGPDISSREVRMHMRKMRYAYLIQSWRFNEYFLYHYADLSRSGRKKFVTETEKNKFCYNVNPQSLRSLFKDKAQTYYHFAKYYGREVCELHSWEQEQEIYNRFVQKHYDYIIKPIDESVGTGIQILHGKQDEVVKDMLESYHKGLVVEELISQDARMAQIHPQSVNTVRITTFVVGDKTYILYPFVRFGRAGNVVDNGGKGGLISAIDKETGIVFSSVDETGGKYIVHPDTGETIVGFRIPRWDEAISMAKELSRILPECRFVGWDLALTDKGWVMVEGNAHGQFVGFQLPRLQGIRNVLLSLDPDCLK